MPVERALPAGGSARRHRPFERCGRAAIVTFVCGAMSCRGEPPPPVLLDNAAPSGGRVAAVRLVACDSGWCESLWLGASADTATRLATLPAGERCSEIAWSPDGKRVGFLINGHQLRLYDPQSHAPAGLLDLVPADAKPTTRIARGITFSGNGAAITFDDCPRDRSGCQPGMVGLR